MKILNKTVFGIKLNFNQYSNSLINYNYAYVTCNLHMY